MTGNRIFLRLAGLFLSLALAVSSCEKPATSITIAPPNTHPSGGSGSGNGNGNGSGSGNGSGNGSGSGTGTGTGTGTEPGTLCTDIGQTPIVLAYFTEYTEVLPEVKLLTHINYAHGRFKNRKTGDGGIVITESSKAPISKVVALKSVNPKLKVMLMIGGWGPHADGFSEMAKSPAKRTEFCQSVKSLLDQHKLDGVDIDWEYPTHKVEEKDENGNNYVNGYDPMDTQNFNLVLKELRETLGTSKIISYASSSSHPEYVDWATAINYIDYVNVMTYDMGAAPKGHNSPLHKGERFTHSSWDEAVQKHEKYHVPKNRQVMGVPFYGKAEKTPADADKVFVDSKGKLGYSIKYRDIVPVLENGTYMGVALNRKLHRVWDTRSMVPFLADDTGRNFLSYDDPESVAAKGAYVKANGHLGAMFWEYRSDTDDHALLKSLVKAIYGKESVLQ